MKRSGMAAPHRLVRPELRFKSATNEWATPDSLWQPLNAEFAFTLDVCSTDANAKCARHFTLADDGLKQPWSGVCWMNPPYGTQLAKWVRKAYEESQRGALVVGLIPVRSNTSYWHDYVMKGEYRFLRGYPRFGNAKQGLKAPLAVVVWRPNAAHDGGAKGERMTTRKRTMSRPVGGLVRLTPRYSGRNSHEFWRRINALKGKDWDAAYSMGVALQNHEHTVLQFINAKKPKTSREAR